MDILIFQQMAPVGGLIAFLFTILVLIIIIIALRYLIAALKVPQEAAMIIYLIIAVVALYWLWRQFGGML